MRREGSEHERKREELTRDDRRGEEREKKRQ
jgi:hypothetical protein